MARIIAFFYGIAAYLVAAAALLYAIGFVSGIAVPKTIDEGAAAPAAAALLVDLLLISVFALQHSAMARRPFKAWWTRLVPEAVERSTYVLFSSLALILLFWQWRPLPAVVWRIETPVLAAAIDGLSFVGWLMALISTFLLNHFEFFGLHQVATHLAGRSMPRSRFRTPLFYRFVRHPIYLGFVIAFWAAATMTVGHLLFAAVTTAYILIGILLEERDLVALYGDDYRRYRSRVAMLVPWRRSA
jgi:protein-S-isoprenylcysteine O-methyltransferase Ste14